MEPVPDTAVDQEPETRQPQDLGQNQIIWPQRKAIKQKCRNKMISNDTAILIYQSVSQLSSERLSPAAKEIKYRD